MQMFLSTYLVNLETQGPGHLESHKTGTNLKEIRFVNADGLYSLSRFIVCFLQN